MENTNNVLIPVEVSTTSELATILKAEIDMQITTAKAYPRSLKQFYDKALSMATFNEDIAASCSYALPRQGKIIDGASVRLAEIVSSTYGNIRSGARVISNDGKTITAQGICHDLETNNCVTVEVKRKITNKEGKTFNEDMQVLTGNAACAIAFRNAVFKVIPSAFVQEIYEQTKEVAKGKAETLVKRRDKAIEYFKSISVSEKQICDALEIKKIEDIDLDKLGVLRGMVTAIKDGTTSVKELFEKESKEPVDTTNRIEKLKENGSK